MDRKEIEALARLAKLEFSDQELDEFTNDMSNIIGFVNRLSELDTSGVAPASHVSGEVNVFREDEVKESISREAVLSVAPERDDSTFIIPRVI